MNKLDELFKERLTDYSVVPSARAWQKVEAGLSKKNKTVAWLRWAAVLLPGGLLLGSLWLQRQDNSLPIAKEQQPVQQKNEMENQKTVAPTLAEKKPAIKNVVGKKRASTLTQPPVQQESLAKVEAVQVVEEQSTMPVQPVETLAVEVTKVSPQASKGIVLTYTLDPIEDESKAVEVAASDKKDNSLKRVVDFAKNVKNGDAPLGGIRVMKEELFALDLKKKTTNKNN